MQNDEQRIREMVATWMAATKSGDTATILSLMTDDVVFLIAGRPPMIGKNAFAAAMAQQNGAGQMEFEGKSEIQEIQVAGDWAFMWTKLSMTVRMPGEATAMTRAGCTLSVLKKIDRKWLLARDANMLAKV